MQTRLLQFLCVERLAALDAPARAAILNGMQASGVFRYMGDEGKETLHASPVGFHSVLRRMVLVCKVLD